MEEQHRASRYRGAMRSLQIHKWLGRPALLCAAACLALANLHAAEPTGANLQFHSADGATHTLTELRGHVAVVNFWATWCGPCREEMPRLQKLADAYGSRSVQFIAISLDAPDTQPKIPQVIAKRNLHIPVWTGADETTLKALDLGELVPATLILDDSGEVIGRIEGEASDKDIRSRVDWLLNGRTGKQPKPVQRNDW
jgi:thiol-disulfide isomerase/thioredoxin